jgi:hypothetical protein
MSDQAQTLTPEQEAWGVLYDEVVLPEFEAKCAANGRTFSSAEGVLQGHADAQEIKKHAAQKSASVADAAHVDLCKALGIQTAEEKQADVKEQEQTEKQASDARIQAAIATLTAAGK